MTIRFVFILLAFFITNLSFSQKGLESKDVKLLMKDMVFVKGDTVCIIYFEKMMVNRKKLILEVCGNVKMNSRY